MKGVQVCSSRLWNENHRRTGAQALEETKRDVEDCQEDTCAEIVTKSRKKLERSWILESCDEVCTLHVARKMKENE